MARGKLRNKLVGIILLVTLFALITSLAYFTLRDINKSKREMIDNSRTTATILSISIGSAVDFDDQEEARKTLSQLRTISYIKNALIYTNSGRLFVSYAASDECKMEPVPLQSLPEGFSGDFLHIKESIMIEDKYLGTIYLRVSARPLREKISSFIINTIIVTVILLVISFLLTLGLQKFISGPILYLADLFNKVTEKKDYSLKIERESKDEIGILYKGFNNMMKEIHRQQEDLKEHKKNLEKMVEERTRELSEANADLSKLSIAVKDSPNIVMITKPDGEIEYVNPKFEEVTGYKAIEVIGRKARSLDETSYDEETYNQLWAALQMGQEWKGEFVNTKKNGQQYIEEIFISAARDESGNITNFIKVSEDITLRKEAERKMLEAKEAAERANRLKSEFLANMSHEIRTPMNAILGFTKILLEDEGNKEKREYLEIINTSGENLLALLNDILDFSKIEADKIVFSKVIFSLKKLLQHVEKVFRIKTDNKEIYFKLNISKRVPDFFWGDSHRINQVILNLAGNAVKFTREGGVTISCDYDKGEAIIIIKDTGIGIDREKMAIVFSPFTQVDGSTTREFGGTGLGLAISKKIINLMGGSITLKSQPNKGSTFTITLPLPQTEPEETREQERERKADGSTRGKVIAIIEDNENDRRLLRHVLIKHHYHVVAIEGTDHVPEQIVKNRADLVVMDLKLKDKDGFQINDILKRDIRTAHIPVIVYSSSAEIEKTLAYGIIDYIKKPLKEEEVLKRIYITLKTSHSIRNIFVVDDNDYLLRLYSNYLRRHKYNAFAFNSADKALQKIKEGVNPDMIVLDLLMPKVDGFTFLRILREDLKLKDIPVIIVTAKELTGKDIDFLNKHTLEIFSKGANIHQKFIKFFDHYFRGRSEMGEKLVQKWFKKTKGQRNLKEILKEAIASLPIKIARLEQEILFNNQEGLKFQSHSLKGISLNTNMNELADLARQINEEASKKKYNINKINRLFIELKETVYSIPSQYFDKRDEGEGTLLLTKKINILVAEDDEVNQMLVKTYFKRLKHKCDIAENGQVALEMLKKKKYHLLFLDIQMPVMDGEELVKRLREDKQLKDIYVIAITAHSIKGDEEKYIKAGCDDYLSKPVTIDTLVEKLNVASFKLKDLS